jgi:hypothetical protein
MVQEFLFGPKKKEISTMEDRLLDRLVTLGFIKKYEYTQEVPLPEDDDLEKEVLVLYFDDYMS